MKPPTDSVSALPGALVISLDFELHWGVRDHHAANGPYRDHLIGARDAVLQTLEMFEAYEVAATWAIVGFLFAESRQGLREASPEVRPQYHDVHLDPYPEPLGEGEQDDPLHFAPSLIERIRATPRQEIGTHTFSHFYCGEPGATPEAFAADLGAAQRIAGDSAPLRSIVFPRNQSGEAFVRVLPEHGVGVYRGNPPGWLWEVEEGEAGRRLWRRAARLADAYAPVGGDDTMAWSSVVETDDIANVRASRFLRPVSDRLSVLEPLRVRRITRSVRRAARRRRLFHLWWHPHNFGVNREANLGVLRRVLDAFAEMREREGMRSLTMAEAADLARSAGGTA